ncbi:tetratricopeptide repeat protein [Tahibacter aquaticus]|uniref:Tetratricopeptide repeat protein n=1 Tax=Tahibacter aquaticus TaxID=520092 RepID=A0A4R6YN80_9GAMM|nr:tetratricopeptide repeat protein [Tahibacter aquaticus]TDR38998.1 tetratricopeptide repeat protein [Tahibacter aquaticus]
MSGAAVWRHCLRLAAVAFAAAVLPAAGAPAPDEADTPTARCRELQTRQPAQAIDVCEQAFAALDPRADAELAEEMLFRRSDAQAATGDFAAAAATLQRVAGLPAAAVHWMREFRLARRSGILAYRQEKFGDALLKFRQARELALAHSDETALAQSWNDLGNALRRIGDYREALNAYLSSLELKRRGKDEQLGPLYNNLADLYRDLDEFDTAQSRYTEALAEYERSQRPREAAHARESLAAVLIKTGALEPAGLALDQVVAAFASLGARNDEIRAQVAVAALALDRKDLPKARTALARAQALAVELNLPLSANLALQTARLYRADGNLAAARTTLTGALARQSADAADRAPLLQASAEAAFAAGDVAGAYVLQQSFHEADARLRDAAHDRRLEQLRVQFDVAEQQRAIDRLAAENRIAALALQQRTTQLQLGLACALVLLLLLAGGFMRARQRSQVAAAVRETRLADEREQFRRMAESLRADSRRIQTLLDRSQSALLAIDASGALVALTAAAAALLDRPREAALGTVLADFLDTGSREALQQALAALDDQDSQVELRLQLPQGSAVARCSLLPGDTDIAVLHIVATGAADADAADGDSATVAVDTVVGEPADTDAFRRELVELMVYAVETWERSSGRTRIDLAEKSRVWRVTIDEGRLRVRAMERYLSLAKLPRQPRWREVLRTAYFVLSECRLDAAERDALRERAEAVQTSLRRRALV